MASRLLPAAAMLMLAAPPPLRAASPEKENEVKEILRRMETDVLSFRDELERLAASRCDASALAECADGNYNDCSSAYPGQRCMEADELVVPACGDGETCNALWSPFETAVRIPATLAMDSLGNPLDPQVVESVCYSRTAEQYMINNYKPGNQMYFGSALGSFRIIPARHSEVCGVYDPRRRPWFVAASSGPKDVVLVIDISTSMDDYMRMETAKEAAVTIVDTLTVADRFSIIAFSNDATQLGEQGGLMRATRENKDRMIAEINNLRADGATNFYAAFDAAFDAIDQTYRKQDITGCNAAVLFLTDGQITEGPGEDGVVNLVNERVTNISTDYDQRTTIFTFSLGDKADHNVTKTIACNTNGIHTAVDDFTDDLVSAMSSYYKLYALGLGEGGDEDWVAWVAPYQAHTAGKMGTSASAPVYDRSVRPPQFLGVAAVDMWMDDLEEILGEDAASSTMLDRFVKLSTARCPATELTECEIDALRFAGGGEEAVCGACGNATAATGLSGILPDKCRVDGDRRRLVRRTDLFIHLWDNIDMLGKRHEDRACCKIGETAPSNVCPLDSSSNMFWIVGICVAVVTVLGFIICIWKGKAIRASVQKRLSANSNVCAETESSSASGMGQSCGIELAPAFPPGQTLPPAPGGAGAETGKADVNLIRLDSIDPPADDPKPAQAEESKRSKQPSTDPPADEPKTVRTEMLTHSRSSTISWNAIPDESSTSPFNPQYNGNNGTDSTSLEMLPVPPPPNASHVHDLPSTLPPSSITNETSSSTTSKPNKEKESMVEESRVAEPTDNDVLFDGGGAADAHPGTVEFRRKASELRPWYKQSAASKEERKGIVELLVESVISEGNRLLERGEDGGWRELTGKGARKRAGQALRGKS